MRTARRILACFLSLTLFASQSGCVRQEVKPFPPPPSEAVRSLFGRVAVTWVSDEPSEEAMIPPGGTCDGMGRGALTGMMWDGVITLAVIGGSLQGGAGGGGGGAVLVLFFVGGVLALGIAVLPLAALIGAIYGGIAAPSLEEVEAAIAAFRHAVTETRLSRRIAEGIVDSGRTRTDASLTLVERQAPLPPCDTILQVGTPSVVLTGTYGVNPSLSLRIALPVRMIQASDGMVLHDLSLVRTGAEAVEFLRWTAEGARAVRSELDAAAGPFIDRLVEEIFLLHLLPLNRPWKESP